MRVSVCLLSCAYFRNIIIIINWLAESISLFDSALCAIESCVCDRIELGVKQSAK